jgi:hypothetical protein
MRMKVLRTLLLLVGAGGGDQDWMTTCLVLLLLQIKWAVQLQVMLRQGLESGVAAGRTARML